MACKYGKLKNPKGRRVCKKRKSHGRGKRSKCPKGCR